MSSPTRSELESHAFYIFFDLEFYFEDQGLFCDPIEAKDSTHNADIEHNTIGKELLDHDSIHWGKGFPQRPSGGDEIVLLMSFKYSGEMIPMTFIVDEDAECVLQFGRDGLRQMFSEWKNDEEVFAAAVRSKPRTKGQAHVSQTNSKIWSRRLTNLLEQDERIQAKKIEVKIRREEQKKKANENTNKYWENPSFTDQIVVWQQPPNP